MCSVILVLCRIRMFVFAFCLYFINRNLTSFLRTRHGMTLSSIFLCCSGASSTVTRISQNIPVLFRSVINITPLMYIPGNLFCLLNHFVSCHDHCYFKSTIQRLAVYVTLFRNLSQVLDCDYRLLWIYSAETERNRSDCYKLESELMNSNGDE